MNCRYHFKPGWWCSGKWMHMGPCSLRPKWWNVSRFAMRYRGTLRDWWRG